MSEDKTYDGQCYCGAVKLRATGDPVGAGYCHCLPSRFSLSHFGGNSMS